MTVDPPSAAHRLSRICLLLLLGASLACGLYALANGWTRLHVRHQLDYEEGNVLNAAVLITHGQTPYPPPQSWPIVINPYRPVPYYLTAIPVSMRGPNFAAARTLVWFSTLLCGLFAGLIARHVIQSSIAGVIATSLFISHSLVQYWMPILRVDLIGLALALGGLWVFLCWPRAWLVAVLLFVAAIFTKPTFFAAPLACFLSLIVAKEFRKAAIFGASGAALGTIALLFMQRQTHGAFWFYLFGTHPDPWRFSHYLLMFRYFLHGAPILIVVAVAAFLCLLLRRNFDLLTLYTICALLATFTAGKLGSNDNHMLELTAVACTLSATALARWASSTRVLSFVASIACLLLAAWISLQLRFIPTAAPEPDCNLCYNLVQQWPSERILSEDVGALVLAGKPVWVSNPFVYGQLTTSGKWSDEAVSSRIRSHWFDLIVLSEDARMNTDRWSPALRDEISRNYRLAARFRCEGAKAVYVPNGDDDAKH